MTALVSGLLFGWEAKDVLFVDHRSAIVLFFLSKSTYFVPFPVEVGNGIAATVSEEQNATTVVSAFFGLYINGDGASIFKFHPLSLWKRYMNQSLT